MRSPMYVTHLPFLLVQLPMIACMTIEYETKTLVNNTFILWNVSGTEQQTYELGITAHVITNKLSGS